MTRWWSLHLFGGYNVAWVIGVSELIWRDVEPQHVDSESLDESPISDPSPLIRRIVGGLDKTSGTSAEVDNDDIDDRVPQAGRPFRGRRKRCELGSETIVH